MEVAEWGKTEILKADKSVIINTILMATPIYYLSVYPIPDSVITKLSRIARKFLWANCDQGNSMPLVNQDTINTFKTEGGLDIKNLLKVNHTLMAKNLLNFLNN